MRRQSLLLLWLSFIGFLTVAVSAPADSGISGVGSSSRKPVKLLDYKNKINPDGSYEYRYSLDDGTEQEAKGTIKEVDGKKVLSVRGFYGFSFPDDTQLEIQYEADENGFRILSNQLYNDDRIGIKAVGSLLG